MGLIPALSMICNGNRVCYCLLPGCDFVWFVEDQVQPFTVVDFINAGLRLPTLAIVSIYGERPSDPSFRSNNIFSLNLI